MAILLHFFFLSAFAWMLVEGLHLYSMVVKVFGSEGSKHFYYYGIGWGKPARSRRSYVLIPLQIRRPRGTRLTQIQQFNNNNDNNNHHHHLFQMFKVFKCGKGNLNQMSNVSFQVEPISMNYF